MNKRLRGLLIFFGVAVVLVALDRERVPSLKQNQANSPSPAPELNRDQKNTSPSDVIEKLPRLASREKYNEALADLFSSTPLSAQSRSSEAAANAVAATNASKSSEPVSPSFPFAVIGKQSKAQNWEVFLADQAHSFVVREGDTVAAAYSIIAIKPPTMQVLYLPTQTALTVMIGAPFSE